MKREFARILGNMSRCRTCTVSCYYVGARKGEKRVMGKVGAEKGAEKSEGLKDIPIRRQIEALGVRTSSVGSFYFELLLSSRDNSTQVLLQCFW